MNLCDFIPDSNNAALEQGILYVSGKYRTATHLCACGCGKKVVTPLKDGFWTLTQGGAGPTLSPSIGNFDIPCRSHYFIRNGDVIWC